ncbi:MAG: helix-turn-helix domain-containing protein [Anaerolineae bacterium]|jgi:hypothetical protein|nr:helix-turn-helix domain-containing protein [Anaerolineae bacterium]MBT7189410.1 helix-turn-helix domain-containing protein [Anaerolineae bacterium]MBT7991997.1 helix-turn-helix domain-containing protein [Anaerolineae bacterium]
MSTEYEILVRFFPKKERVVAQFADVILKERVWGFEDSSNKNIRRLRISRQELVPPYSISDYITTEDAHNYSGYSISYLCKLARDKSIEALKIQNRWLILKESLDDYINQTHMETENAIK